LHEVTRLKEAEVLEKNIATTFESVVSKRAMTVSLERSKNAKIFLQPYKGQYFSEIQVRELIHQTGIRTFPRPKGIPENYRVKLSNKPGGMKYAHPENEGSYVSVMPGKPHSPFSQQKGPYVNHRINGKSLDKFGNIVSNDLPEAHIPINEFVYRE